MNINTNFRKITLSLAALRLLSLEASDNINKIKIDDPAKDISGAIGSQPPIPVHSNPFSGPIDYNDWWKDYGSKSYRKNQKFTAELEAIWKQIQDSKESLINWLTHPEQSNSWADQTPLIQTIFPIQMQQQAAEALKSYLQAPFTGKQISRKAFHLLALSQPQFAIAWALKNKIHSQVERISMLTESTSRYVLNLFKTLVPENQSLQVLRLTKLTEPRKSVLNFWNNPQEFLDTQSNRSQKSFLDGSYRNTKQKYCSDNSTIMKDNFNRWRRDNLERSKKCALDYRNNIVKFQKSSRQVFQNDLRLQIHALPPMAWEVLVQGSPQFPGSCSPIDWKKHPEFQTDWDHKYKKIQLNSFINQPVLIQPLQVEPNQTQPRAGFKTITSSQLVSYREQNQWQIRFYQNVVTNNNNGNLIIATQEAIGIPNWLEKDAQIPPVQTFQHSQNPLLPIKVEDPTDSSDQSSAD
jgi:hypothetical protein